MRVPSENHPAARDVERWCRDFAARCRERGVRVTPQRLAVYRALAADISHPTVEAVHARVRAELPTVSQATVYRVLESLEREGLVRRVSTTGGGARFDANVAPHQHLVCRVCGRMVDHHVPFLANTRVPPEAAPGFVVEELDIRLVGRCETCAPGRAAGAPDAMRRAAVASHSNRYRNRRRT